MSNPGWKKTYYIKLKNLAYVRLVDVEFTHLEPGYHRIVTCDILPPKLCEVAEEFYLTYNYKPHWEGEIDEILTNARSDLPWSYRDPKFIKFILSFDEEPNPESLEFNGLEKLLEKNPTYVNRDGIVHKTMSCYNFDGYPFIISEEESDDKSKSDKSEITAVEYETVKIKEVEKISLDEDEALVVKLPEGTSEYGAQQAFDQLKAMLGTDRIIIFVGDVALTKINLSQHKKDHHPLY